MNYTKPEITLAAPASLAIQGGKKDVQPMTDSEKEFLLSEPAYEADE